jgi:hypothetical protein
MKIGSLKKQTVKSVVLTQNQTTGQNADYITAECKKELSDQAKAIHKQESKLKERMDFDIDRTYYFSVVFKNTQERNAFLQKHGIKLQSDVYLYGSDIKSLSLI